MPASYRRTHARMQQETDARRGGASSRRVPARDGGGFGARSGRRNLRRARRRLERRRLGEVQRRLDHAAALPRELRRQRRRRPPRPVARLRQRAADVRLPHRARPDQRRDPRQLAGTHTPSPGRGLRRAAAPAGSSSPRAARVSRQRRLSSPAARASRWRSPPPAADSPRPRSSCAAAAEAVVDCRRGRWPRSGAVADRAYKAAAQPVGSL